MQRKLKTREYSKFEITKAVLDDHVKIGPVTGIEVFKSAQNLVKEVQAPPQQPRNSASWVRKSREIEKYAPQIIPTERD